MAKKYTLWVTVEEVDTQTCRCRDIELTMPLWVEKARDLSLEELAAVIMEIDPSWVDGKSLEKVLKVLREEVKS
jgi:hypothetical protein